jgi:phosphoglycerate kinase
LLPHLDRLFIGGALAFSFLKAAGRETGKAPIEPACLRLIRDFIEEARTRTEIVLPEDFMVRNGTTIRCSFELRPDDQPVDIGTHTMAHLSDLMQDAYSVLWIDSLGVHGRVLRLMQGKVSETVLDKARCPVLIARIAGDCAEEVFGD